MMTINPKVKDSDLSASHIIAVHIIPLLKALDSALKALPCLELKDKITREYECIFTRMCKYDFTLKENISNLPRCLSSSFACFCFWTVDFIYPEDRIHSLLFMALYILFRYEFVGDFLFVVSSDNNSILGCRRSSDTFNINSWDTP